jgi:hypothetical protein
MSAYFFFGGSEERTEARVAIDDGGALPPQNRGADDGAKLFGNGERRRHARGL